MAFSLSPAVSVSEYDLSLTVPNLPSSRTGMVITTDKGECLTIKSITSESDLVNNFGKPNATNYQSWFQAWNFLQYASSLYVVRPLPKKSGSTTVNVENASVDFDGLTDPVWGSEASFYNGVLAENSIDTLSTTFSGKLKFVNKEVTNNQDLAIAVCSNEVSFKKPIAQEMFIKLANTTNTTGAIPAVTTSAFSSVYATGINFNNLYKDTDIILNFNKRYTISGVTSVSGSNGLVYTCTVKTAQAAADPLTASAFSKFVLDVVTADTTSGTYNPTSSIVHVGAEFLETDSTSAGFRITSLVSPNIFYYTAFNSGAPATGVYASNTATYTGTVSENSATSGDIVTMNAGHTYVVGATLFSKTIVAIDEINNLIYLDADAATITTGDVSTQTIYDSIVVAANGYDKYFDDSVIKRTRIQLYDGSYYNKQSLVTFDDLFEYVPDFLNDQFVTVILQKNSYGKYAYLEKILASYVNAKDEQGKNIYANDIYYNNCKSFYCIVGTSNLKVDTTGMTLSKFENSTALTDTVYTAYTAANVQEAAEMFADSESFDINLLIAHELDINVMSEIAETRKDCVAIVAPCRADDIAAMTTRSASDVATYLCRNFGSVLPQDAGSDKVFRTFGTYSAVYGNLKYQYDKFNDINRWISPMGDIAGLYAQTDANRDPWWAPAGIDRGKIKNVIKLAFNPNKQNRDDLYYNAINPIITVAGEGMGIVFGQKTATKKPSAFDRVNVRRLLIVLEKSISTSARYSLFEFNDAFTRNRIKGMIEPYLRNVKSRRGLYDYLVVCDETNNTGQIIDANALVIDLYLKPTRVAEFIQINAYVTRTDANFQELVGQQ